MRILIDAGHGGDDSGAINKITNQREDRTNFNVSLMLAAMLTKKSHDISLMRKSHDETITLNTRMAAILTIKPELVISIHHNAFNTTAKGAEVLAQVANDTSYKFAQELLKQFENIGQKTRSVVRKWNSSKTEDYYGILRYSQKVHCPAVITEFAFIDNKYDVQMINTYEKQWKQAEAICQAVDKIF